MIAFRRISILAAFLAVSFIMPASAQQRIQIGELVQRIDRLEAEVARLRVSPTNGGGDVARLDQIEAELRRLTGLIERLDFESRKLAKTTEQNFSDFDDRLTALEDGGFAPQSAAPPFAYNTESAPDAPAVSNVAPIPDYAPSASLAPQQTALAPAEPYGSAAPVYAQPSGQSSEQLYQNGLRLLNNGSFDQAGAQFEELIAAHPKDQRAGQAQYWLGEMHFKLGRFEQAATAFLNSFRNWPEGAKAPDSLLKLGMTLGMIGKREEACLSLSQVAVRYPSAPPNLLRRADIEGQRAGCGS